MIIAIDGPSGAGKSTLGKMLDGQRLLIAFALLMLVVGALMLRKRAGHGDIAVTLNRNNFPMLAVLGLCTGVLSGFFGIGGGFLIVPALMLATGMPILNAIGSSLVVWPAAGFPLMAKRNGSALVIINPRGSTGYGQKFVDDVSKAWAGKVYTDLMNGLDAALARNTWMDSTRLGAAGGSFGGYMVNWIAGHSTRFKALVSHAGPFNLENMATATEEIWFPDWEYGGPFWNSKAMATQYRVYSPHLYVKNFKTPTLVTGGELDYRVPYTEDLSMFTALQRMNVPSRLVMFPDEGHWIGKPQNQRLWWGEVQGWLQKYLEGKPKA